MSCIRARDRAFFKCWPYSRVPGDGCRPFALVQFPDARRDATTNFSMLESQTDEKR